MSPINGTASGMNGSFKPSNNSKARREYKEEFKALMSSEKNGRHDDTEMNNGGSQLMAFDDLLENELHNI